MGEKDEQTALLDVYQSDLYCIKRLLVIKHQQINDHTSLTVQ